MHLVLHIMGIFFPIVLLFCTKSKLRMFYCYLFFPLFPFYFWEKIFAEISLSWHIFTHNLLLWISQCKTILFTRTLTQQSWEYYVVSILLYVQRFTLLRNYCKQTNKRALASIHAIIRLQHIWCALIMHEKMTDQKYSRTHIVS